MKQPARRGLFFIILIFPVIFLDFWPACVPAFEFSAWRALMRLDAGP